MFTFLSETLPNWEAAFLLWIQDDVRCGVLNVIFRFFSALGNGGILWISLGLLLLIFPKSRKSGLFLLLSVAFGFLVNNVLLKNLVARARPYETIEGLRAIVSLPTDYSFPSGHTCSSFAAAGSLCQSSSRRWVKWTSLSLATCIALSRVYVGVHYPTDVLAGALIGLAGSWLVWHAGRHLSEADGKIPHHA